MKKLTAKIGEYTKDGQTKGRYCNIGVVMSNDNGEYILLDPTVSLGGVMAMQNSLAMQKGEQLRDRIMVGVFEEDQGAQQYNQQPQQQGGYQQQQQRPAPQHQQSPNQHVPHSQQYQQDPPF